MSRQDSTRRGRPPSIRYRLLLSIDVVCGVLLVVLVAFEYRREIADAVAEARHTLEKQASVLHLAVVHLRAEHGDTAVQSFVDTACGRVAGLDSPEHHVAVVLRNGRVLRAREGRGATTTTSRRDGGRGHDSLPGDRVVGEFEKDGIRVSISESVEERLADVRRHAITRLLVLAGLGVLAGTILNLVFLRYVAGPIDRLIAAVHRIGEGRFGESAETFGTRELQFLADEIAGMSRVLADAEEQRQGRMRRALDIQQHLLPGAVAVTGATLAARFRPAEDVAGDFYQVKQLSDGSWLLCIADVTGHGIPAAMGAALLVAMLDHAVESTCSPKRIVEFVNRRLIETGLPGCFPTMIVVRWEASRGRVTYANAGHVAGSLLTSGLHERLDSTGIVLGVDLDQRWDERELRIADDALLFLTTDGLLEAHDSHGRMLGRGPIDAILDRRSDESVDELVASIDETFAAHVGSSEILDDVTFLLVELAGRLVAPTVETSAAPLHSSVD